eukprot:gene13097-15980_t
MSLNLSPTLRTLVWKEFRLAYRDRIMSTLAIIIYTLFAVSSLLTVFQYQQEEQGREHANAKFRDQFKAQHTNPHDAAHFGTFLFKPLNLISAFDPGLNDYFGTTYRVEAHVQHEVDYSNAESNNALMRFGSFSLAMIMQLLIPLLLLFISSSSITFEKESGTFKVLMAQGIKPIQLVWGKVFANYLFVVLLVLPFFIVLLLFLFFAPSGTWLTGRFLFIIAGYLVFYLLVTLTGVLVSVLAKRSGTAIIIVLNLWLFSCVLLPKVATGLADKRYPLMSRAAFKDHIKVGFLKGINGDPPYQERAENYLKALLKKYKVDTASKLPVNADGLILQYNEDYQNKVFDHYYALLEHTFNQQQSFLNNAGLLNPFISLKRFSMAMSGTDFYHHQNFFMQKGQQAYVASPEFFRNLKDFQYDFPSLPSVAWMQKTGIISICCWTLLLGVFEWRQFFRQPAQLLLLLFFLLMGFYSLSTGRHFVRQQLSGLDTLVQNQKSHFKELLERFDVDTSTSKATNPPRGLVLMAIGQGDILPYFDIINSKRDILTPPNAEIANPEKLASGNFDFSFVLVYLFPLLIIILCYDLYAKEKEQQTDRLLHVIIGFLIHPAGTPLSAADVLLWFFVLTSYLLFWFSVCWLVVVLRQSSQVNSLILLGIWLFFTLILPALMNKLAALKYPMPSRTELVSHQRETMLDTWEMPIKELMVHFYRNNPQYLSLRQTSDTAQYGNKRFVAYYDLLSSKTAWLNPVAQMQSLINGTAQTDLTDYLFYQQQAGDFQNRWVKLMNSYLLNNKKLSKEEVMNLPVFQPEKDKSRTSRVLINSLSLWMAIALILWPFTYGQTDSTSHHKVNKLKEVNVTKQRVVKLHADTLTNTMKLQLPLLKTPQNIIRISSALLQQQGGLELRDAARNASGVYFGYNSTPFDNSATAQIRGFSAYTTLNGMSRRFNYGSSIDDEALIESVEFIKGPAGFLNSVGEPGGSINIATKTPGPKLLNVLVNAGSFNFFRTSVDIGSQVKNKGFSYRFNMAYQHKDTYLSDLRTEKYVVAPVVQYNFSPNTFVLAEYDFVRGESQNGSVIAKVRNDAQKLKGPIRLNYSAATGLPISYTENQTARIYGVHKFNENWQLTSQSSYLLAPYSNWNMTSAGSMVNFRPDGFMTKRRSYLVMGTGKTFSSQLFVNGKLKTGAISHQLLLGADYTNSKDSLSLNNGKIEFPYFKDNPNNDVNPNLARQTTRQSRLDNNTFLKSAFVYDNLQLHRKLLLTLGARYTWYTNERSSTNAKGVVKVNNYKQKALSPRAALTFLMDSSTTAFFLYDQSFVPQSGQKAIVSATNELVGSEAVDPQRGTNMEIGLKRNWFGTRLYTTLSGFHTVKSNVLVADLVNAGFLKQLGQVTSNGIELDVIGNITDQLSLVTNYTFVKATITKDIDSELIGKQLPQTPQQIFNTWIQYKFPLRNQASLNLSAGQTTMIKRSTSEKNEYIPNYTKFDAGI